MNVLNINRINQLIHNCLEIDNYVYIDNFIKQYSLNNIINYKNKSLISLILQYAIKINDNNMIEEIKPH